MSVIRVIAVSIFLLLCVQPFACFSQVRETVNSFASSYQETTTFQYILLLPKRYTETKAKWPIILYLHGAGERGHNLSLLRDSPAIQIAETRRDSPFIFVAPQEPNLDQSWNYPTNTTAVLRLLDIILSQYGGDPARIYLTGESMGGWGTWFIAKSYPSRFAAIAPLCGLDPSLRWANRLVNVPVWAFHGTDDKVADPKATESMIETLQNLGANPKYTPLVGLGHDIAKNVYSRNDLYEWFLQHHR